MKIRSISLLEIILILTSSLGTNISKENINEYLNEDPSEVACFLEKNLHAFVNEYNNSNEIKWNAAFVEDKFPITYNYLGADYNGYFIDFDSQNGYCVVGDEYSLFDLQVTGDSPYKNIDSDFYYFDSVTGYYFKKGESLINVDQEKNELIDYSFNDLKAAYEFDGAREVSYSKFGGIIDPEAYIHDRYGSNFQIKKQNSITSSCSTQPSLSVYKNWRVIDGEFHSFSEGNCWIVSAYNALQALSNSKFPNLPEKYNKTLYNPKIQEPSIYSIYYNLNDNSPKSRIINCGNEQHNEYELYSNLNFPNLYINIREATNYLFGQVNDGGSTGMTAEIMIYVLAYYYNYGPTIQVHETWRNYVNTGTNNIDNGWPLIWSFPNHTVAVFGYKYYSKKTNISNFTLANSKLLYQIGDGHNSETIYYDMSAHDAALKTGDIISIGD